MSENYDLTNYRDDIQAVKDNFEFILTMLPNKNLTGRFIKASVKELKEDLDDLIMQIRDLDEGEDDE